MGEVSIIGLDLAKRVFQAHGKCSKGSAVFRKKLSRSQVLTFLAQQPRCIVAMEACGSAHFWGRAIRELGHEIRLIPPVYVKPFVKRQKNDAADAEAIAEAAARPNMRFVALKSSGQQAGAMVFRTRDLLVRQRTQLVNALRGHLAEHGVVAPQGMTNVRVLEAAIEDAETSLDLLVVEMARLYLQQIASLAEQIAKLEKVLQHEAANAPTTARLLTVPGIGHVTAMAMETFAPSMETFRRGRDFAAWLGLVPLQHSTGGKQVLGKTAKMGQRDIRRLLIAGAMTVVRWASRKSPPEGSWLFPMLGRKPRMLVAIALANKMARAVWAMLTKGEDYRNPATAAA
ncbi:IS110 family transposase [Novosphingobium sp. SG707]|uniref:IS110 family transposase n=1 Tax=Novosphingobium sp. SG707 TaxID=2586996 RepID=UPI0014479FF7|nr:IS110 family transposase [Novosphingobium sp. SG707]NKJ02735.1 transposase [Novosphingobium sp. SG707]